MSSNLSIRRESVLQEFPDCEFTFLEPAEFDVAIIGVTAHGSRVAYSIDKILETLEINRGMTYQGALEYFDFNIACAFMGETTPEYIWEV